MSCNCGNSFKAFLPDNIKKKVDPEKELKKKMIEREKEKRK